MDLLGKEKADELRKLVLGALDIDVKKDLKEDEKLLDTSDMKARIEELLESNAHFPTKDLVDLCKVKSVRELEEGNFHEAGLTLVQSHGVAFRHQILFQYDKRLKKMKDQKGAAEEDLFQDEEEKDVQIRTMELMKSTLAFQTKASANEKIVENLAQLPKEWRVLQVLYEYLTT